MSGQHSAQSPDQLSEEELQQYFLYLLSFVRPPRERKLPVVLSQGNAGYHGGQAGNAAARAVRRPVVPSLLALFFVH